MKRNRRDLTDHLKAFSEVASEWNPKSSLAKVGILVMSATTQVHMCAFSNFYGRMRLRGTNWRNELTLEEQSKLGKVEIDATDLLTQVQRDYPDDTPDVQFSLWQHKLKALGDIHGRIGCDVLDKLFPDMSKKGRLRRESEKQKRIAKAKRYALAPADVAERDARRRVANKNRRRAKAQGA